MTCLPWTTRLCMSFTNPGELCTHILVPQACSIKATAAALHSDSCAGSWHSVQLSDCMTIVGVAGGEQLIACSDSWRTFQACW